MFQAIAKSALDLDDLGSVRVLFRFRQPVDLVYVSIYVKGLLLLVPHGLHEVVDMMSMHMRSMLLYNICLLRVYVCYMLLYVICLLYVMCLLCV